MTADNDKMILSTILLEFLYRGTSQLGLAVISCGFERGQHELLNQILKKLRKLQKQYGVK